MRLTDEQRARVEALTAAFKDEGRCATDIGAQSQAERIVRWGCCDLARPIRCDHGPCKLALHCPEHGETHHGHEE